MTQKSRTMRASKLCAPLRTFLLGSICQWVPKVARSIHIPKHRGPRGDRFLGKRPWQITGGFDKRPCQTKGRRGSATAFPRKLHLLFLSRISFWAVAHKLDPHLALRGVPCVFQLSNTSKSVLNICKKQYITLWDCMPRGTMRRPPGGLPTRAHMR